MRLDPDAAAILQRVREAGVPPWRSLPPAQGREVYRQRAMLFQGPKTPAGTVWDTTISGPAGAIPIRIYRPDGRRPRPIFVYLHGGGWVLGDLDTHDAVCRRIAKAADCMVVSVAYRLAPENPYPAALDDSIAAIRWLQQHGDELGGDPKRLAVGGDSAGGNLTAAAALRMREEGGPQMGLQVLIYPGLAAFFDMLSHHENAEGYLLTRADLVWFWDQFLPTAEAAADPFACPGIAPDLRDLPPAVVITADFDPLRDEGDVYALRLRAAGVPVAARRFRGMIHGFVALPVEIAAGRRAVGMIAAATRRAWTPGGWR